MTPVYRVENVTSNCNNIWECGNEEPNKVLLHILLKKLLLHGASRKGQFGFFNICYTKGFKFRD